VHQSISIGTAQHKELLKHKLAQELQSYKNKGLDVRLEEIPAGWLTFLHCSVFGARHAEPLKRQVAGIITDLIVDNWEDTLLRDIIRLNYYYFDEAEKGTIYDYAQKKLNFSKQFKERNKLLILQKLVEYFNSNSDIVIDGFIRFRLKEYVNGLHDVADQAVDDFLMEREHREFIELLRYFVDMQEPRVDQVNIVLRPDGSFQLFNKEGQVINNDHFEDFLLGLTESEINYEDLLISTLITIAPQEIKFHPGNSKLPAGTIDTIRDVFTGRVFVCPGCSLCWREK